MKQMHLRLEDNLYAELAKYSADIEQSIQDCVREAIAYYISGVNKKNIESEIRDFKFVDLFAGIGEIGRAHV